MDKFLSEAGDRIDFVRIGDDYGTQEGLIMSRQMWRAHIQPALKAIMKVIKIHGAYYYHHT